MKGIVLAGGTATRLGELTRITNKHLLPIGDYPMIYYPLQALQRAGITEICLISGKEHAGRFIELLGDGTVVDRTGVEVFNLDITYRMQTKPGGIAQAIALAKNFVGNDKFVVVLGDNIMEYSIAPYVKKFVEQSDGARILLWKPENSSAYGVPDIDEEAKTIRQVEEKPKNPKSLYAVIGVYMLDSRVFEYARQILPSARGELEVTDLLNEYIKHSRLEYDILQGWWRDAGQSQRELHEISALIYETGANK
ncbi:NTP transferase domain-containing protein [Candidatus Uhrbacteria bacterium]|nr:NTP transferase domain-containing protein [Candidatus Uhrbacteria bacterium]